MKKREQPLASRTRLQYHQNKARSYQRNDRFQPFKVGVRKEYPLLDLTAALAALGGASSRPVTDAVRNGSQIADRFTISWFSEKQKGLNPSVFTFRENH